MSHDILRPTNDWIFKLLFGDERNKSALADLLKSFMELPDEEYDLIYLDPHLKRERKEDKLGILDVKVPGTEAKSTKVLAEPDNRQAGKGHRSQTGEVEVWLCQTSESNPPCGLDHCPSTSPN